MLPLRLHANGVETPPSRCLLLDDYGPSLRVCHCSLSLVPAAGKSLFAVSACSRLLVSHIADLGGFSSSMFGFLALLFQSRSSRPPLLLVPCDCLLRRKLILSLCSCVATFPLSCSLTSMLPGTFRSCSGPGATPTTLAVFLLCYNARLVAAEKLSTTCVREKL